MSGDWSEDTRRRVSERSEDVCERCGTFRATHLHHRLPRGYGIHTIENSLHCCAGCHQDIHAYPERSEEYGWIIVPVRGAALDALPGTRPVRYRGQDAHLSPDGWVLV